MSERNLDLPGMLGGLQWVDSPDYGGRPEDRRIPRVYDVDPAPLAMLLSVQLGTIEGDETESMRELAEHADAPVHMGLASAAAAFRMMDADTRSRVLDILLNYWLAPVLGVRADLTDEMIRPEGRPG
jgi:hypothetical protein